MKNHRIRGTSSAGRRVLRLLSAACQMVSGKTIEYSSSPPVSTLTSAISPSAPAIQLRRDDYH